MFRHMVALLFVAALASSKNERNPRTLYRDGKRGGPSKPETMFGRYGRASASEESTRDEPFELDPKAISGLGAQQRSGVAGLSSSYGVPPKISSFVHDDANGVVASKSSGFGGGLGLGGLGSHGLGGLDSHGLGGLDSHGLGGLSSHGLGGLGSHGLGGLGSHGLGGLDSHGLGGLGSHGLGGLGSHGLGGLGSNGFGGSGSKGLGGLGVHGGLGGLGSHGGLGAGLSKFGPCGDGLERTIYGKCVSPLVSQDLFIYKAPSYRVPYEPVNYEHKPKVHLNFVFIKSPSIEGDLPKPVVVPPPKQKTHVYLLSKKPDGRHQQIIEVPHNHEKPEVYFVGYKDGDNPVLPGGIDLKTALSQAAHPGDGPGLGYGGGALIDAGHHTGGHGLGVASLGSGGHGGSFSGHDDGSFLQGHDDVGFSAGHGGSIGGGVVSKGGFSGGVVGGGFSSGSFSHGHGGGVSLGHDGGSFSHGQGGSVTLGHGGGGFSHGKGISVGLSAGGKGGFSGGVVGGHGGADFLDYGGAFDLSGGEHGSTVDDLILDLGKGKGGFKNPNFRDGLEAALANDNVDEIVIDHGIQDVGKPKLVAEVVGSLHGGGAGSGSVHGAGAHGGVGSGGFFGAHGAGHNTGSFAGLELSGHGGSLRGGSQGHGFGKRSSGRGFGATAHVEGVGVFTGGKGFRRSGFESDFDDSLEDFKKHGGSVLKANKVVLKGV